MNLLIKHLSIRNTSWPEPTYFDCYQICQHSFIRRVELPTAKPKQGGAHGKTILTQLGSTCIKVYSIKTSGYLTTRTPERAITINISLPYKETTEFKIKRKK